MPSVDHSIVELDDGPPGDEGDVEVVWHRASGRASTPPLGPPGDTYDPFQPSEDEPPAPRGPPAPTFGPRGGLPPLPGRFSQPPPGRGGPPPPPGDGVVTLDSWEKSQEQKLNKSGLGLPPPLPPPPLAPPPSGPHKPPPPPVSFIRDADKDHEADSQRERERKRFLTNSAMGADEAKMRLKAYAATVADKEGNFGMMYPSEKKKNKELKKFFDEDKSADEPKYKNVGRNVSDTLVDKMAQITKEIDLEKAEYEKKVEKHIKELKREKRRKRSRSGSREKRESRDRDSKSRDRDSRSRDRDSRASRSRDSKSKRKTRDRSDSGSSNEGRREEGDGKEDFTLSKQFSPAPDPNTKEGRAKLYRMELEEKSKQYMEWQKHVAGKEEWEMELEGTAAFKYVEDTPSPDRQPEYLDPEFRPGGPGAGAPPKPPGSNAWDNEGPPKPPKPTPNPSQQDSETATGFGQYPPPPRPTGTESSMPPKPPAPCPPPPGVELPDNTVEDLNKLYNDPKLYEQATSLPGA